MLIKVKEPNWDENWDCSRCHQSYCRECVPIYKLDFSVDEKDRVTTFHWTSITEVCPWCYNQLVDLKNKQEAQHVNKR